MEKGGYVYILTNKNNSVLYTGVTSNLLQRIHDHRSKIYARSFTNKYKVFNLVYFQAFPTIIEAITEEKRIKGGRRAAKVALIEGMNPGWEDLYDGLFL